MDEPTKTAEESSGAETTTQDAPTGSEQTTENEVEIQEQTETPDPGESEQETTTQQETKPSRVEKRLRQLLHKDGDGGKSGEEETSQDTTSSQDLDAPPWYQPKVEPGQEVSPEQYKADVARTAQEISALEIKKFRQEEAAKRDQIQKVTSFAEAVTEVEDKYPVLKEGSKEFNQSLSDKVSKLFEKASGKQPNADLLKEIVETVMEASEYAKVEGQSSVTSAMVDQAAQEAIRPTGGNQKTDLSQADMEQLKRDNPAKLAEILGKKLSWTN